MIPHRVQRHRPPQPLTRRLGVPAPVDDALALPADALRVLRLVAAEMRDMPRDCATDRHELVHWLGRLARRLEDLAASKGRRPTSPAVIPPRPAGQAPAGPTAAPAAISAPAVAPAAMPTLRPRQARRGPPWRAVPIAAAARRQAEAMGQLDLFR